MATTPALNTGTSIIDYLKSTGGDSSFGARSGLYGSAGLNMGAYTGSAQQNSALLGYLQKNGSGGSKTVASPTPGSAAPVPSAPASPPAGTPTASPRAGYVESSIQAQLDANAKAQAAKDAARAKLTEAYSTLEDPTARFQRISGEQGLPEQQALVDALTKQTLETNNSLDSVEPSVNDRTSDFLVTEGDRQAIVNRERQPILEALNKLLNNKSIQEVGLAGKQQMVSTLLQLASQADENRLKPLQLGVDFTTEDQNVATKLWESITNARQSAFNADQSAQESRDSADLAFQRQKELENLKSANDLKTSLATKGADTTKKDAAAKADDVFNTILASSKTERDVWNYINQNQDKLRAQGVDVDQLWRKHNELAAKTGVGGSIRAEKSGTDYSSFLNN
jgi:hypothetical protein